MLRTRRRVQMERKHALELIQMRPQVRDLLVPDLQQLLQLSNLLLLDLEERVQFLHRAHRLRGAGDRSNGCSEPGVRFLVGSVKPGREAECAEADSHSLGRAWRGGRAGYCGAFGNGARRRELNTEKKEARRVVSLPRGGSDCDFGDYRLAIICNSPRSCGRFSSGSWLSCFIGIAGNWDCGLMATEWHILSGLARKRPETRKCALIKNFSASLSDILILGSGCSTYRLTTFICQVITLLVITTNRSILILTFTAEITNKWTRQFCCNVAF